MFNSMYMHFFSFSYTVCLYYVELVYRSMLHLIELQDWAGQPGQISSQIKKQWCRTHIWIWMPD